MFAIVAALYFTRDILIPLAFALTFTFMLTPVVTYLEKLRMGRVLPVVLTVLVSIAAAGWITWIIAGQLVDVASQLPTYRQNIHSKIETLRNRGKGPLGRAADSAKDIGREISGPDAPAIVPAPSAQNQKQRNAPKIVGPPVPVQIVQTRTNGLADLPDFVKPFLAPLGRAGIILIFTIFMLVKREDLRNRLLRLVGLGQLNMMTQALDDAAQRVSRYLFIQFLVNAGFGMLFAIGLYLIGVPNPVLWGVLAGIMRIVPYVGTLFAATLPIILSLAVFDGWLPPMLVFLLFAGLELIIGNFVEPWLYGAHTGISSLALLVTAVFWTVMWGPAGLILSTPLTVCVVVLGRYFPQLSFLHVLLGDEQALEAEAQLYQRLLAMDQPEARAVVDSFLKGRRLIELYDAVLIPALSLAEQDRHNGTIDVAHEEFLFLSINEMIAEFSEYHSVLSSPEEEGAAAREPGPAVQFSGRILCLPAHDQADEITAAMLAQLLEQEGYVALSFPHGTPPLEMLALADPGIDDVICVSALPPYAFAPARMICKQIRGRFPKIKLVAGMWGFAGNAEKAKARFERYQPDRLVTDLAQALEQIEELVSPPRSDELQPESTIREPELQVEKSRSTPSATTHGVLLYLSVLLEENLNGAGHVSAAPDVHRGLRGLLQSHRDPVYG
ncbi:MAG TPA: AI-2E family transporter [Bryobacteraceae bacterium]|nr:AI-2E family transporter [Bryobacteraceae bacterium]